MWPKVFAQLVELMPHISRLIPMADVFFASKTAADKAGESTLSVLAGDVRGELKQVTSAHEALFRQLQAQGTQIAGIEAETYRIRTAVEDQLVHTAELQKQLDSLGLWIRAAAVLLLIAIALLITLLRSR